MLPIKRGCVISGPARLNWRRSISPKVYAFVLLAATVWPQVARQVLASPPDSNHLDAGVEELVQHGHWKRARAILEPQVKAHPQDPRACYLLAELKMSLAIRNCERVTVRITGIRHPAKVPSHQPAAGLRSFRRREIAANFHGRLKAGLRTARHLSPAARKSCRTRALGCRSYSPTHTMIVVMPWKSGSSRNASKSDSLSIRGGSTDREKERCHYHCFRL